MDEELALLYSCNRPGPGAHEAGVGRCAQSATSEGARSCRLGPTKAATAGLSLLILTGVAWVVVSRPYAQSSGLRCNPNYVDSGSMTLPMQQLNAPPAAKFLRKARMLDQEMLSVKPGVSYGQLFMPAFHIAAPIGTWMNDPNGLMDAADGIKHVFYQHNPNASVWGSMHWGHVASRDLARWVRLPIALKPDRWWDRDGVFSGSAAFDAVGNPFFLYTGVLNYSEWGFYYQVQATAVPVNMSDPLLREWQQLDLTSMEIPPGGTHAQFRDPITPWLMNRSLAQQQLPNLVSRVYGQEAAATTDRDPFLDSDQQLWFTAVGTLQQCVGGASLYASADLRTWHYAGPLYSQFSQNFTDIEQCMRVVEQDTPKGTKSFGGDCDQFGKSCHMFECPDYWSAPFDDGSNRTIQVIKYSDQVRHRSNFGSDWYVLSDVGDLRMTDIPLHRNATLAHQHNSSVAVGAAGGPEPAVHDAVGMLDMPDAFVSQLAGFPFAPRLVDYGAVYASKTMQLRDGRTVWMGWVYEDSEGCTEMCGDGTDFIRKYQQWQGMQTLPRLTAYDPVSASLTFYPVKELEVLRQHNPQHSDGWRITFPAMPATLPNVISQNGKGTPQPSSLQEQTPQLNVQPTISEHNADAQSGTAALGTAASGVQQSDGLAETASGADIGLTLQPRHVLLSESAAGTTDSTSLPDLGSSEQRNAYCSGNLYPYQYDTFSSTLVPAEPSPAGPRRRQLEIRASFALQPSSTLPAQLPVSAPFQAGIILRTGGDTSTRVFLAGQVTYMPNSNVTAAGGPGGGGTASAVPVVDSLDVAVDRTCSGGATRRTLNNTQVLEDADTLKAARRRIKLPQGAVWQGGPVDLPSAGLPAGMQSTGGRQVWGQDPWGLDGSIPSLPLTLSVWVDASVIEAYAMGGHGRVTTRFYPLENDVAWGVDVFAGCKLASVVSQVSLYELGSCWVDTL